MALCVQMSVSQHILRHDDLPGVIMQEGDNDVIWLLPFPPLFLCCGAALMNYRRAELGDKCRPGFRVITFKNKTSFLLTEKRVSVFSFHILLSWHPANLGFFCNYSSFPTVIDFLVTYV